MFGVFQDVGGDVGDDVGGVFNVVWGVEGCWR